MVGEVTSARLARGIGSVSGDGLNIRAETKAIVANAAVRPTNARIALMDALIVALIDAGIWAKLDVLYVLAAADAQTAGLNWKNPQTNQLAVNNVVFTVDRGFTGNGALTSSLMPGLSWNGFSQFSLNSGHIGVWELSNVSENQRAIGGGASHNASIVPRSGGGLLTGRINDGTDIAGTPVASASGYSVLNRSGSSSREAYRDGALVGSDTTASTGIPNTSVSFLRSSGASTNRQLAAGLIGSSISSGEVSAERTALYGYLQAVGAV